MSAPVPDPVLAVATAERANARRLLEEHIDEHGKTATGGCDKCASLDGHLREIEEQVRLLTGAEVETESMFARAYPGDPDA